MKLCIDDEQNDPPRQRFVPFWRSYWWRKLYYQWRYPHYDDYDIIVLLPHNTTPLTMSSTTFLHPGQQGITLYLGHSQEEQITIFALPRTKNPFVRWWWQLRLAYAQWRIRLTI